MAATGNDCHFFYTNSCTKGKDCTFRHSEPALGCEITCTLWRKGMCTRPNCKFRHMEVVQSAFHYYNRANVQCYWENQPDGCKKPNCQFLHKKERVLAPETGECASNVSNLTESSLNSDIPHHNGALLELSKQGLNAMAKSFHNSPCPPSESSKKHLNSLSKSFHVSSPCVPPVVVNTADNEESDGELTTELSSKLQNKISVVCSDVPKDSPSTTHHDLGIKTLEQLRMDKVMKESSHFYAPVYHSKTHMYSSHIEPRRKSPTLEWKVKTANDAVSPSYIDLDDPIQRISRNYNPHSPPPDDLRDIILRKRNVRSKSPSPPLTSRRIISLKKSLSNIDVDDLHTSTPRKVRSIVDKRSKENCVRHEFEDKEEIEKKKRRKHSKGSMDFHVKSLAEIRREKEKRKIELIQRGNEDEGSTHGKKIKLTSVANTQFAKRSIQQINKPMSLGCNRPIGNYKPPAKRNYEDYQPTSSQYNRPFAKRIWKDFQKEKQVEGKLSADFRASVHAAQKLRAMKPTQPVYTVVPKPRNLPVKKRPSSEPLDLEKMAEEASPSKQSYLSLRSAFTSKPKAKVNQGKRKEVADVPCFKKLKLNPDEVASKNDEVEKSMKSNEEEENVKAKLSSEEESQRIQIKIEPRDEHSDDELSLHAHEFKSDDLLLPENKIKEEVHSESSSAHSDDNPKLNDEINDNTSTLPLLAPDEIKKEHDNSFENSEQGEVNDFPPLRVSKNSSGDDFDTILTKECGLNLEELDTSSSEKVDDIFSEIEKILEN